MPMSSKSKNFFVQYSGAASNTVTAQLQGPQLNLAFRFMHVCKCPPGSLIYSWFWLAMLTCPYIWKRCEYAAWDLPEIWTGFPIREYCHLMPIGRIIPSVNVTSDTETGNHVTPVWPFILFCFFIIIFLLTWVGSWITRSPLPWLSHRRPGWWQSL